MNLEKLPTDLKNMIADYVFSAIHYDAFKESLHCIEVRGLASCIRNDDVSYTTKEVRQMIDTLNTCRCCERHQCNKPKSLYDTNLKSYIQFWDSITANEYSCTCQCRQSCRHLIREYNTQAILYQRYIDTLYILQTWTTQLFNAFTEYDQLLVHLEYTSHITALTNRLGQEYDEYCVVINDYCEKTYRISNLIDSIDEQYVDLTALYNDIIPITVLDQLDAHTEHIKMKSRQELRRDIKEHISKHIAKYYSIASMVNKIFTMQIRENVMNIGNEYTKYSFKELLDQLSCLI